MIPKEKKSSSKKSLRRSLFLQNLGMDIDKPNRFPKNWATINVITQRKSLILGSAEEL